MKYTTAEGKAAAVFGCLTGLDCQLLVLAGANKVLGIDLDARIGTDYTAPNVEYINASICNVQSIPDNTLDIVYSVAVFEHVFNIQGAFAESKRILKQGGIAYILSSPLWNSPYGHHFKNLLYDIPWAHLVLGQKSLRDLVGNAGIDTFDGKSVDEIIDYMYSPLNFNRYPSSFYEYAANAMSGVAIMENKVS